MCSSSACFAIHSYSRSIFHVHYKFEVILSKFCIIALWRHNEIHGDNSDLISYDSSLQTSLSWHIQADFGYVVQQQIMQRLTQIAVLYHFAWNNSPVEEAIIVLKDYCQLFNDITTR